MRRGSRLTVTINGAPVFQDADVSGLTERQAVQLRHDGQAVEFASIFVKE
jgi:hypothetical protein